MDCPFCGILDDRSGSDVVWEDDDVLAFMNLNPVADGHVLVIPKVHHTGLTDIDAQTAGRMMQVSQFSGDAFRIHAPSARRSAEARAESAAAIRQALG